VGEVSLHHPFGVSEAVGSTELCLEKASGVQSTSGTAEEIHFANVHGLPQQGHQNFAGPTKWGRVMESMLPFQFKTIGNWVLFEKYNT